MSNKKSISRFHRLPIGIGPADDKAAALIFCGQIERLGERGYHIDRRRGIGPRELGDDYIMALGESAPDRLESHPAHNNRAACCCLTEVAHVSREIPKQLVLFSDRVIVRYGYDNTLFHH